MEDLVKKDYYWWHGHWSRGHFSLRPRARGLEIRMLCEVQYLTICQLTRKFDSQSGVVSYFSYFKSSQFRVVTRVKSFEKCDSGQAMTWVIPALLWLRPDLQRWSVTKYFCYIEVLAWALSSLITCSNACVLPLLLYAFLISSSINCLDIFALHLWVKLSNNRAMHHGRRM